MSTREHMDAVVLEFAEAVKSYLDDDSRSVRRKYAIRAEAVAIITAFKSDR